MCILQYDAYAFSSYICWMAGLNGWAWDVHRRKFDRWKQTWNCNLLQIWIFMFLIWICGIYVSLCLNKLLAVRTIQTFRSSSVRLGLGKPLPNQLPNAHTHDNLASIKSGISQFSYSGINWFSYMWNKFVRGGVSSLIQSEEHVYGNSINSRYVKSNTMLKLMLIMNLK